MCRQGSVLGVLACVLGFEAWQTAGSKALTREGYVEARERFRGFRAFYGFEAWQTAGPKALTREGYVQARERFRGFRRFRGLKPGKRQARRP